MTPAPKTSPASKSPKRSSPKSVSREVAAEMFKRLAKARPDPKTELDYKDPYTLVVAVALSAQATDVGVNKATKELFRIADTPAKMVKLGEEGVAAHIRTIGLWRNKAKNVIALSRLILEKHNGQTPRTREDLEALPGVGHKTASVVLNEAYGEATIAVDTHVFRVSNRTGLAPGKTVEAVEKKLMKRVPLKYLSHAHHWLILHGRYICVARTPKCPNCPVADLCDFKHKTKELDAKRPAGRLGAA